MTRSRIVIVTVVLLATCALASTGEIVGETHTYVYRTDPAETLVSTPRVVPGMKTTFELEARQPILATFCAETEVDGAMMVGVRVDGAALLPGEVSLDEEYVPDPGSEIRSHCFTFASGPLDPGRHVVEVMWRKIGTPPGAGYARMLFRALTLEAL